MNHSELTIQIKTFDDLSHITITQNTNNITRVLKQRTKYPNLKCVHTRNFKKL